MKWFINIQRDRRSFKKIQEEILLFILNEKINIKQQTYNSYF